MLNEVFQAQEKWYQMETVLHKGIACANGKYVGLKKKSFGNLGPKYNLLSSGFLVKSPHKLYLFS